MPIVNINLMAGRTLEQKRNLVAEVTKAVTKTLGSDPTHVRVILSEMAEENYAIAGKLIQDTENPFS